ncbi:hypothetical protein GCM10027414_21540 [Humibacter ginsengiterrae]
MSTPDRSIIVAVTTPLEPDLAARIAAVDDRLQVRYEPELLPPARFPGDHRGVEGFQRTTEQEVSWQRLLADAEVVLGVPGTPRKDLSSSCGRTPACGGCRPPEATRTSRCTAPG